MVNVFDAVPGAYEAARGAGRKGPAPPPRPEVPRIFVALRLLPAEDPPITVIRISRRRWQRFAKRLMDSSLALLLLVVALPILLSAGLAIKLQDGGSVLFRQERVGRNGRRFTLYKLRTMVPDAESQLERLLLHNERQGGPLFKLADDPRVTRVGRFLRATSIDELPQLFNVLRGTMSLVGPRPALPAEVAQFDKELLQRLHVLPGVTGLWQVVARDDTAFESYRRLDLAYLGGWSLRLDAVIVMATAAHVLNRLVASVVTGRTGSIAPMTRAGSGIYP